MVATEKTGEHGTRKKVENAEGEKKDWIDLWNDPVASLHGFSHSMCLCDGTGMGDGVLVVAGLDGVLRMYRGKEMFWKGELSGLAVGVVSFYSSEQEPRIPEIAVGSGKTVYIYRDGWPYSKFTVPGTRLVGEEAEVWEAMLEGRLGVEEATDKLKGRQVELSPRSIQFLGLEGKTKAQSRFMKRYQGFPLVDDTCVTCMGSLRKNLDEDKACGFLVLGTESKDLLIVNSQANKILRTIRLEGVPACFVVMGLMDVEYRIIVATRDGKLCSIKNGKLVRGGIIDLESKPCHLVPTGLKQVAVACMNHCVYSYTVKGRKNWMINLRSRVTAMIPYRHNAQHGFILALDTGEVRIYNEKIVVSKFQVSTPLLGMSFGQYGREENVLLMIDEAGGLSVKMLRRNVSLDPSKAQKPGPPQEQDIPLNVPKKTKLYVDQTQRERDQATEMHRIFQHDLCKLRLQTAREYVKTLPIPELASLKREGAPVGDYLGQTPISNPRITSATFRLNATVSGIGPSFQIHVDLVNTTSLSHQDINMVLRFDRSLYHVPKPIQTIPLLLPQIVHKYSFLVHSVSPTGAADNVQVLLLQQGRASPSVVATLTMPISSQF